MDCRMRRNRDVSDHAARTGIWHTRSRFLTNKDSMGDHPQKANSTQAPATPPSNPSQEVIKDEEPLVQRLSALYNSELFSDIVLRIGEHRFHAHKFMLITSSEVFEAMLSEQRWREANQPEVTLTEDEECIPVFGDFLKYIYSGLVTLTTDTVLPILLLADKYCIRKLCESCVMYMLRHIVESPDTNRTLSWYQYAKMTRCQELQDNCLRFIVSNFHIVQNSPDWLELSRMEMREFLESSDIIVDSEFALWKELEKWILHENNLQQVEDNLSALLPLVRFSLMTPKQLLEVEGSRLFKEHHGIFGDRVLQAYRRHSLLSENVLISGESEDLRNYEDKDYQIACSLLLSNYNSKGKTETRIFIENMIVPLKFTPASAVQKEKLVKFQVEFFPKGFFLPHILYGNYIGRQNDNTTLIIRRLSNNCPKMKVEMTLIIYGKKNHVKYAAHSISRSYEFSKYVTKWEIPDVIPLGKLKEEKSFFLVNGNFEGKLFLKVQSFEEEQDP